MRERFWFFILWNRALLFGINWIPRHTGVGFPRNEFHLYVGPMEIILWVRIKHG